jgi:hypothetical protein
MRDQKRCVRVVVESESLFSAHTALLNTDFGRKSRGVSSVGQEKEGRPD